jgi:hypothetical protein
MPLVEQDETYRIGVAAGPFANSNMGNPRQNFCDRTVTLAVLSLANPDAAVWVRQVGSYAQSDALLLTMLS